MLFIGMDISCTMRLARMATVCGNLSLLISRRSVGGMTELNAGLENWLLILRKYFIVKCSLLISRGISFVITWRDSVGVDFQQPEAILRHSMAMGSISCFVVWDAD